jgi:YVTN family beta-propeller protein
MRRLLLVLASMCAVSLTTVTAVARADDGGGSGPRDGAVWVANRDKGEVTIFDAASGTPARTFLTGAGAHEVAIAEQARQAYVTNETENTVSVLSTRTLLGHKLALGPRPHHAEASKDGRRVLVGLYDANRIAVINTRTGIVREYTTSTNPAAKAHSGVLSRDGKTIYVAHEVGDEVTGVDVATGAITLSVHGINQPSEVLLDRNGRHLYVTARGEGKVKVIDVASAIVAAEVVVGTQPETMLLTRDQGTLVVTLRGTPASLAFMNITTLAVDTLGIAGPGTFGDLAAMSKDGRFAYATFDRGPTGIGGVAVVDLQRRALVDTWAYPGTGRPHGIAWTHVQPADR